MAPDRSTILNRAIEVCGEDTQMLMMIEEAAELTKAISKWRRDECASTAANVLEEIADVQIMLDQMRIMFDDTGEIEQRKLNRLWERLESKHGGKVL